MKSAGELLGGTSTEVRAWVAERLEAVSDGPPFNWHGLADGAAHNCHDAHDLDWAWVAVVVHDALAVKKPAVAHSHWLSAAIVRTAMVRRWGLREGDAVLTLAPDERYFREVGTARLWEAVSTWEVEPWDGEAVLALRRLKNRAKLLARLPMELVEGAAPSAEAWVRVWEALP